MKKGNSDERGILIPHEIALTAESTGISKAGMGSAKTIMLSILAGAFIALGAVFSTLAISGSNLPFGITKVLAGLTFSLGLILVVIGGAELFTGNSLMIVAWAGKKITAKEIFRNWILVYAGNLAGAFSVVILMLFSGHYLMGEGLVGEKILSIAADKCDLPFGRALVLGILCNILVCLAIWMSYSTRSLQGKTLAIIFPITAFVAAGFEHSVANMYFIPMGLAVKTWGNPELWPMIQSSASQFEALTWGNFLIMNLLPVTIGNSIGGGIFIGLAYWIIYLSPVNRQTKEKPKSAMT